jgi:hypothetical protein
MIIKKNIVQVFLLLLCLAIGFFVGQKWDKNMPLLDTFQKLMPKAQKISVTDDLQNGDIIFQISLSAQGKAIQLATHSVYTHCGIIFQKNKQFFVYEAVQPVKITPLQTWINRGKNQHYVVKRLKNADKILSPEVLQKMQAYGLQCKGKNYDLYFSWSDDKIYCSELVWKMYKQAANIEIGKLEKLQDFDLTSAEVQQKMQERYGKNIPFNEIVVSPASIYASDLLQTVKEN